jgi:hypothetical protein
MLHSSVASRYGESQTGQTMNYKTYFEEQELLVAEEQAIDDLEYARYDELQDKANEAWLDDEYNRWVLYQESQYR